MKLFISDMHYYHKRVIDYCNRPFKSLDEMHEQLIRRWNCVVTKRDEVYIIGDWGLCGVERGKEIVSQLNGTKIIICGNHDDSPRRLYRMGFDEVDSYLRVIEDEDLGKIVLCHYPYYPTTVEWLKMRIKGYKPHHEDKFLKRGFLREDWLFHGHVHNSWGQINYNRHMVNVSCDVWGYAPVTFKEIKTSINRRLHGLW